jgi:hypothetical protein
MSAHTPYIVHFLVGIKPQPKTTLPSRGGFGFGDILVLV